MAELDEKKAADASPAISEKPDNGTNRKSFKHARQDGNAVQRLLWRFLSPPEVPAERRPAGEESANILSRIVFQWPFHTVWAATTRHLEMNDIELLNPRYRAGRKTTEFLGWLGHHLSHGSGQPLLRAIWSTWRTRFLIALVCGVSSVHLEVANAVLLRYFGLWLQNAFQQGGGHPAWVGVLMMLGFAIVALIALVSRAHAYYQLHVIGAQARTVLSTSMYSKAMRISPTAVRPSAKDSGAADSSGGSDGDGDGDGDGTDSAATSKAASDVFWTEGPILHSMAVDTNRIELAIGEIGTPVYSLLSLPAMVGLSYFFFGWPGIICLAVGLVCGSAFNFWMGVVIAKGRKPVNRMSEQRANLVNDMLKGVRFLKVFAWEDVFLRRFQNVRDEESRKLRGVLLRTITSFMGGLIFTRGVQLVSTLLHLWYVGDLRDSYNVVAFQYLFYIFVVMFNRFQNKVVVVATARPSVANVQDFLLAEEHDPAKDIGPVSDPTVAYELDNASFSWLGAASSNDNAPKVEFTVSSVTLTIRRPELVAIVGPVACGKSSFVTGLLGQMAVTGGRVCGPPPTQVAMCSQTTWIQNASVRENITFGVLFDQERYRRIVRVCALEQDFADFRHGDMTELGERGINLSGGQKARIQLARTLYRNSDTVILDDPLSAVDPRTAAHIFQEAIKGELASKTVLLITHQLYVLNQCDRVIWMGDQGTIRAVDTYENLVAQHPDFTDFVGSSSKYLLKKRGAHHTSGGGVIDAKMDNDDDDKDDDNAKTVEKLMADEDRGIKPIEARLYFRYVRMGYPWPIVAALISMLAVSQAFNMSFLASLPWWSARTWGLLDWQYAVITLAMMVGHMVTWGWYWVNFQIMFVRSSQELVRRAIDAVFRAPISFFDTTPSGRIMNRFTQDVNFLDSQMPRNLWEISLCTAALVSLVIYIGIYVPISLSLFGPWAMAIALIVYLYRSSPLELRRFERVNESLFVSKLQEGIHGKTALVSYNRVVDFQNALDAIVDELNSVHFMKFAVAQWSETRSSLVSAIIVFLVCVLTVQLRYSLAPALGLFACICAPQFSGYMTVMLESVAEIQAGMNSVERLDEYCNDLPDEGPRHVDGAIGSAWPTDGSIEVEGVDMRYREGLPLALQGLSFAIRSGEKIGIVGRTGAGKSSLINLILRLVNAEAGTVHISGLDVAHIGLYDLRQAIAVIPQDPTLFLGSLRFNLDPSTNDSKPDPEMDARMLAALRAVRLIPDGGQDFGLSEPSSGEPSDTEFDADIKDTGPIRNLTLDTKVETEGKNFSTGHRQLIALARAIVRDTRIVLIDEATSNVDLRNDTHVQGMIREQFRDRTVITIAHRLRTILSYDRIMVMDKGRVVEMGTPLELFDKGDDGLFRDMCVKSQITEADLRQTRV